MKTVPCRSEPLFSNVAQCGGPDGVKERGISSKASFRNVGDVGNSGMICNGRSGAIFLGSALFTKATILGGMHGPAHMMDAPVPGLAINLLGLRFTSLGRDSHPGFVCLLLLLVQSVLFVLLLPSTTIFLRLILLGAAAAISISKSFLAAFGFIFELFSKFEVGTAHLIDLGTEGNDCLCLFRKSTPFLLRLDEIILNLGLGQDSLHGNILQLVGLVPKIIQIVGEVFGKDSVLGLGKHFKNNLRGIIHGFASSLELREVIIDVANDLVHIPITFLSKDFAIANVGSKSSVSGSRV